MGLLPSFVSSGADAAFVFEAGNLMAAGAAVVLDQLLAVRLEVRIVHEIRGGVGRVGVLLRDQEAGDVARIFNRQAQAGHDRHLLDDQLVPVVRAARMIEVKHKWQVVLGVIFRAQILLLERAVGTRARSRIQDPADQIIVVVLLADARKVRGEISADHIRAFADRVAGLAAARFKQRLSVRRRFPELAWEARAR